MANEKKQFTSVLTLLAKDNVVKKERDTYKKSIMIDEDGNPLTTDGEKKVRKQIRKICESWLYSIINNPTENNCRDFADWYEKIYNVTDYSVESLGTSEKIKQFASKAMPIVKKTLGK